MADLSGVTAKLNRAEEHLATLDASLKAWRGSDPYTLTDAKHPDKTEIRFYAHFKVVPDVLRWGLLAGDCVHNLRCALDHVIWEASTIQDTSVEFPIFEDPAKFLSTKRGGGLHKIRGIKRAEARDVICRYQPWRNANGADQDSLWLIHEFDRMDKHQVITPVGIIPRNVNLGLVIEYASEEIAAAAGPPTVVTQPFALKENAEVLSLHFLKPFEGVKMQAHFAFGIAIEYRGNAAGITGTLRNLCQHARRVIEELGNALA